MESLKVDSRYAALDHECVWTIYREPEVSNFYGPLLTSWA